MLSFIKKLFRKPDSSTDALMKDAVHRVVNHKMASGQGGSTKSGHADVSRKKLGVAYDDMEEDMRHLIETQEQQRRDIEDLTRMQDEAMDSHMDHHNHF